MSQSPDPSRRAEEKHPETFRDPDAGQVFPDDRRPPEPLVLGAVRKGCLWAIALTALLLLIIAVTWQWAWNEAEPNLPDPADRDRPAVEAEPPELDESDQVIGEQLGKRSPALGQSPRLLSEFGIHSKDTASRREGRSLSPGEGDDRENRWRWEDAAASAGGDRFAGACGEVQSACPKPFLCSQ